VGQAAAADGPTVVVAVAAVAITNELPMNGFVLTRKKRLFMCSLFFA
jgi:hypothetical protein